MISQKEDQEVQQIAKNPGNGSGTNNIASKTNNNPSGTPPQENGEGENNPTTPTDTDKGGNTSNPPEPEQTPLDKFIADEFKKWLKDESLIEYNNELKSINNFVSINLIGNLAWYELEIKREQIPALDSLFTNAIKEIEIWVTLLI